MTPEITGSHIFVSRLLCIFLFPTTSRCVNKELTEVCTETDRRLLQEFRQQAEHRFEITRTTCGADIGLCYTLYVTRLDLMYRTVCVYFNLLKTKRMCVILRTL